MDKHSVHSQGKYRRRRVYTSSRILVRGLDAGNEAGHLRGREFQDAFKGWVLTHDLAMFGGIGQKSG